MNRSLRIAILLTGLSLGAQLTVYSQCGVSANYSCCDLNPITTSYQTINFTHGYHKTFTAVQGWTYDFSYCSNGGSSAYDTEITIFYTDGSYAGGYNDQYCGNQSELFWIAPSSGDFWIQTDTYPCTGSTTEISIMAYAVYSINNDDCTGAVPVAVPSSTAGTTIGFNSDIAPSCVVSDNTSGGVWYTLTGTGDIITASLCSADYDSYIRIFSGSCGALSCIIGDDDGCGTSGSIATWTSTNGTDYYILVSGYSSYTGNFTLDISSVSPLDPEPASQPTDIAFSNIQSTSFTVTYTAAADSPDGYIGIANINGDYPTSIPVDGTTYSIGEGLSNGDFVSFVGASTGWDVTGAQEWSDYYYSVYSYNGSGSSTNYLTTNPLQGITTTLPPEVDPPTVTNNSPTSVASNEDFTVSLSITDVSGIAYVYIDYGKVEDVVDITNYLDDNVSSIEFDGTTAPDFSHTITAAEIGEMGLVYMVYAYDIYYNEFISGPNVVTVSKSGYNISYSNAGKSQSNYKIVSVPLTLESNTVNSVFGDELGTYGKKDVWRMFRYQGGQNSELSGTSTLDLGKGYWLIANKDVSISTGAGTTFSGTFGTPATLSVSTGWNQIGDPYTFNLLWSDVQDVNAANSLTLGGLKGFSSGSFININTLTPLSGAFVMAQSSGTLTFPLLKNPAAGRVGDPSPNRNAINTDNWEVVFSLKNGDMINEFGGFGMNKDASSSNDRFDDFTLPRFFDYLEVNHHKTFANSPYTKDIIPVEDNHIWEFSVESNLSEPTMVLSWDNTFYGDNEKRLILWDVSRQLAIDMRKVNTYAFESASASEFKVYYGDESFVQESVSTNGIVLHEVFPNPAREKATFAFSLPRDAENIPISLVVFDLMGRRIGTVVDGQFSHGYHEATWQIQEQRDISGGVYLAVLKQGFITKSRKFIIQK